MKLTKLPIKIVAHTRHYIVSGTYNLTEDSRLTDVLNSNEGNRMFLPISDAKVTCTKTGNVNTVPFLSLNKDAIEIIYEEK